MPQKPVFQKAPVLKVAHCFPSNGTIRSSDPRISELYQKTCQWSDQPCLWEGLFGLACLTKNKPLDEPVTGIIMNAIADTEDGSFSGSVSEQICTARAAFAVFEYNTDRAVLRRIAVWMRYLEIEFDQLSVTDRLLYRPADLMELLIRFYMATGLKSVLRLCTKLRASAFDWTTALHTFQQSIPIRTTDGAIPDICFSPTPDGMEYDEKEKMINHAEMLADGMRFTLYSGLFSGNSHDLASGRVVWEYLKKHHRAVCGGTTSDPYLCGCGSDKPVNNRAIAAWAEAFACQMTAEGSEWAADEMIRIIFNGLDDCLNRHEIEETQKVNTVTGKGRPADDKASLMAWVARAVTEAYRHAVTLTEQGIRINYLLPGKYLLMVQKTPVILVSDGVSCTMQCRKSFKASVDFFIPSHGNQRAVLRHADTETVPETEQNGKKDSYYVHTCDEWQNQDGFRFETDRRITAEDTHHQGVCFFDGNRLLSVNAGETDFASAVKSQPERADGKILVRLEKTGAWKLKGNEPADIPVLPDAGNGSVLSVMAPYAQTACRITMFPRKKDACLK